MNKQAIEAGAKGMYLRYNSVRPSPAWEELPENTRMVYREQFTAGLTAALEHIIPESLSESECRKISYKVRDDLLSDGIAEAASLSLSALDCVVASTLSHLRGEGKQAASTPPDILTTNPKCEHCGDTPSCGDGAWRVSGDKSGNYWEHRCRHIHPQAGYSRVDSKPDVPTPPASQEPNPDDVERVARAMFDRSRKLINSQVTWEGMSSEDDRESWRDSARHAIRAMKGQLFGVWWENNLGDSGWVTDENNKDKPFATCDEAAATVIENCMVEIGKLVRRCEPKNRVKYEYEVRPYTAPREESAEEIAKRELQDIADNGLRCDTNPTIQITTSGNETALRYVQYIRQIDSTMRDRAKSALEAIREAEKRGTAKCG